MPNLKDKEVIVTGAANGIGKVISEHYALQGAHIWMIDVDDKKGRKLEAHFSEKGWRSTFVHLDVASPKEIQRFFQMLTEKNIRIDTLINNAGVSSFVSLDELDVEEWDRVLNTNVRSAMLFSKSVVNIKNQGISIINIASTRALMSEPGSEAYAASKGALVALTHALAASLSSEGIRVNAISPGWIQNENYDQLREIDHQQHWSKRVGKPSDIARACLFLSNDENDFITGENLVIDGGMTRKMIYNH
ncbi:hypothetical protein CR194_02480 [Salipaludibacillus keqinensis]|uniref:Oxidoreductase n=1 Tax=Salipaludibacillus keqinensis TaxID=2045207 RepID=A0A323TI17_9BACI|nr:SDR family oxidoreductase [Salipaludibacillus keqinensis]PYZ94419.1 hypothetical protein CR194_02480 [Salipaludibacillus keqinensis]